MDASLAMVMDLKSRADFVYDPSTHRVRLKWPANGKDAAVAATRWLHNKIAAANS